MTRRMRISDDKEDEGWDDRRERSQG